MPDPAKPKDAQVWERDPHDFYTEQRWVADLIIEAEGFRGRVLDPCCGNGTIGRAFEARNHPIRSTDLVQRPYGVGGFDFLSPDTDYGRVDHIVCNPPFGPVLPFIRRGMKIARQSMALLVPLKWLASDERYQFWKEMGRPAIVYVLSNRVSMPPGKYLDPETGRFNCDDPFPKKDKVTGEPRLRWKVGDEPSGGAIDYRWVIFKPGYGGPTDMRWLHRETLEASAPGRPRPAAARTARPHRKPAPEGALMRDARL